MGFNFGGCTSRCLGAQDFEVQGLELLCFGIPLPRKSLPVCGFVGFEGGILHEGQDGNSGFLDSHVFSCSFNFQRFTNFDGKARKCLGLVFLARYEKNRFRWRGVVISTMEVCGVTKIKAEVPHLEFRGPHGRDPTLQGPFFTVGVAHAGLLQQAGYMDGVRPGKQVWPPDATKEASTTRVPLSIGRALAVAARLEPRRTAVD